MEGPAVVQGEEGTLGVEAGDQAGGGAGEGGHLFCSVLGVVGVGWEEGGRYGWAEVRRNMWLARDSVIWNGRTSST